MRERIVQHVCLRVPPTTTQPRPQGFKEKPQGRGWHNGDGNEKYSLSLHLACEAGVRHLREGKGFRCMGGGMETPPHSSLAHAYAPTESHPFPFPTLAMKASLYLNLQVHQNLKVHFFAVRASTTRLRCETYSTFDFLSFWTIDNPHGLHLL